MRFRDTASFGKRIEFWIVGEMIKEGLDVYMPIVDDMGIDAVIRKSNGKFIEVQIKARSKNALFGNSGLFAAIKHEPRNNYFFVFYSERMDTKWIMSSKEFLKECDTNKSGKNKGSSTICFNGKNTKERKEYTKLKFEKYVVLNYDRFHK